MTAAVLPLPAQAYVYVIGAEDGPQKIGVANDPKERRDLFQVGNHALLRIAAAIPVARDEAFKVESYAHFLLDHRHVRGEWFDVSPEEARQAVITAAKAIQEGAETPKPKRKPGITLRLTDQLRAAAERMARENGCSVTALAELSLKTLLKERGYLPNL